MKMAPGSRRGQTRPDREPVLRHRAVVVGHEHRVVGHFFETAIHRERDAPAIADDPAQGRGGERVDRRWRRRRCRSGRRRRSPPPWDRHASSERRHSSRSVPRPIVGTITETASVIIRSDRPRRHAVVCRWPPGRTCRGPAVAPAPHRRRELGIVEEPAQLVRERVRIVLGHDDAAGGIALADDRARRRARRRRRPATRPPSPRSERPETLLGGKAGRRRRRPTGRCRSPPGPVRIRRATARRPGRARRSGRVATGRRSRFPAGAVPRAPRTTPALHTTRRRACRSPSSPRRSGRTTARRGRRVRDRGLRAPLASGA